MCGKVITERALTLQEVRKILEQRNKEGDLNFEQKSTLIYAKEFGKGRIDSATKLVGELTEMGIDEEISVSIVNAKPSTPELVKLFFEKSRFDLTDEKVKQIIGIVK